MFLDSQQLEAFYKVATNLSFSKAANSLGISQPALSIRIRKLEESLSTSLFLRRSSGIALTEVGSKLFLHCQLRGDIEKEFLSDIKVGAKGNAPMTGLIRIAGFSTVVRSVLVPSLSDLILKFPDLQIEVSTREMMDLAQSLRKSEAEFVLTENPIEAGNVESILIGYEDNVIVESKDISPERRNIFLDNDADDQATFNFFKLLKEKPPKFHRWFLDDAHTILEALECGWGRAVHPMHIIRGNKKLRVVPDYKHVPTPVHLNFYKQPFYSKVHLTVREHVIKEFQKRLPKI